MTNDTDLVAVASNASNARRKYHTTECSPYPDNPRMLTREKAEEFGFEHCKLCRGDPIPNTSTRGHLRSLKAAAKGD